MWNGNPPPSEKELERRRADSRARYRSRKRDKEIRPEPPKDDPIAHAAWESGGILKRAQFKPLPKHGCGVPIHIAGTNEGTMPCGARLRHLDGHVERHYCESCREQMTKESDNDNL